MLVILLVIAAIAAVGYYMYNKGPVDVQDSHAQKINAVELYEVFVKDSISANKNYTGKILDVSGEVNEITISQQKQIVTLKTNVDGAYINCTMEKNAQGIRVHDKINIKGICSGIGEGDADLGIPGDVYLTRCYIVSN